MSVNSTCFPFSWKHQSQIKNKVRWCNPPTSRTALLLVDNLVDQGQPRNSSPIELDAPHIYFKWPGGGVHALAKNATNPSTATTGPANNKRRTTCRAKRNDKNVEARQGKVRQRKAKPFQGHPTILARLPFARCPSPTPRLRDRPPTPPPHRLPSPSASPVPASEPSRLLF